VYHLFEIIQNSRAVERQQCIYVASNFSFDSLKRAPSRCEGGDNLFSKRLTWKAEMFTEVQRPFTRNPESLLTADGSSASGDHQSVSSEAGRHSQVSQISQLTRDYIASAATRTGRCTTRCPNAAPKAGFCHWFQFTSRWSTTCLAGSYSAMA